MDCKEFRELLDLYVDYELSPEAMASAGVHSTECESCRRAKAELTRLQHTVKRVVSQYDPPAGLVESVMSVSQSARERRLPSLLFGRWASSAGHGQAGRLRSQANIPFWRRQIALPVPVFALLLAVLFSGLWLAVVRRMDQSSDQAINKTGTDVTRPNAPQDETDIARFDHGGRAAIYKVQLAKPGDGK